MQLLHDSNVQLLLRNQNFDITTAHGSWQTGVEQGLCQRAASHRKAFYSVFACAVAGLNSGWHAQFSARPDYGTKNKPLPGGLLQTCFRFFDRWVFFHYGLQNSLQAHRANGVCPGGRQYRDEELCSYGAPQVLKKKKSSLHRWPNFAGGRATSAACVALRFVFFALSSFDPKSRACAELPQACARRARAALCK